MRFFSRFYKRKKYADINSNFFKSLQKNNKLDNLSLHKISLPNNIIIPIKQYSGITNKLCIKIGDKVLRGQALIYGLEDTTISLHAPTSGEVIDIRPYAMPHDLILYELCIIIKPDGKDQWIKREGWNNFNIFSIKKLTDRIRDHGINGLEEPSLSTGIKLKNNNFKINTLIINATQYESYITANDSLIQEYTTQIIEGINILSYILQPNKIIIGILDSQMQSISILRKALIDRNDIIIHIIPNIYSIRSIKQLIKIIINKKIPYGRHSLDFGILVQDINTTYAIKRSIINGEPLTERIITIFDNSIYKSINVWARIGTPVNHLINEVRFNLDFEYRVIMGDHITGIVLSKIEAPIIKTTNCLLISMVNKLNKTREEQNCIRCALCASICPVNLLPQQLYWLIKGKQYKKTQEYNLNNCIECGGCNLICPSNILLVQNFRFAKAKIYKILTENQRLKMIKSKFKAHQERMNKKNINLNEIKVINLHKDLSNINKLNSIKKENISNIITSAEVDKINLRKDIVANAIARIKSKKEKSHKINIQNKY